MKKSNIELLRIIAFLMVISIHTTSAAIPLAEMYSTNWYYVIIMRIIVCPAVLLFVLISGFFSYNNDKFVLKDKIKKLGIPLLIYLPFLIYLSSITYGWNNVFLTNLKLFLTFTGGYYHLWYMVFYVALIAISPVITQGLNKINKKYIEGIIIVSLLFICMRNILSVYFNISAFNNGFTSIFIIFILMYIIGYYIKRFDFKINKIINLLLLIGAYILCFFLTISRISSTGSPNLVFIDNEGIFPIIISILMFIFFKNWSIRTNKIINDVGKLTYGSYIIHVLYIYLLQILFSFYYLSYLETKYYPFYDLIFITCVALLSFITEYIRQLLLKKIKTGGKNETKNIAIN